MKLEVGDIIDWDGDEYLYVLKIEQTILYFMCFDRTEEGGYYYSNGSYDAWCKYLSHHSSLYKVLKVKK